jgi:predicted nucleic acid-binding protein
MGTEYLIDTNIVIDFSARKLSGKANNYVAQIIDGSPKIPVINKIELLGFNSVPEQITAFTENAFVIGLDDNIVTQTIAIRKEYQVKLPDAIIAATALVYNLTLVTNNVDDFKNIPNLKLSNPYLIS